jgi:opacity protein-like surface antigen
MKLRNSMLVLAATLGTSALLANPAAAQGIENIGNQGQFVIGAERLTGLFFDKIHQEEGDAEQDYSYTTISLLGNNGEAPEGSPSNTPRLGFDYLVTDGLSVGGSLFYITRSGEADGDLADGDLASSNLFYFNPRVGYAYAFDDTFAIWPRAGIGWASGKVESGAGDTELSASSLQLTIEGNLVVSPFEHFAIVGGPFIDFGLSGSVEDEDGDEFDQKFTSFGLTVGIAGYFGE